MVSDEGIVALIHLSAVVAAITIVSAKMDRLHDGGVDAFQDGLAAAKPTAEQIRLKLGLDKPLPQGKWRLPTLFPAHVICLVADKRLALGTFQRFLHFFYRQFHIPMLVYFRKPLHKWLIGIIATTSVLLFFALVAATLWDFGWIEDRQILKAAFFILTTFAVYIFTTSILSSRLSTKRLETKCEKLAATIDKRNNARLAKAFATVKAFEENA